MYPAAFDYSAPTTLDEALSVLSQADEDAKVLAGGQSLIPMMKIRLAAPTVLVDINRLPGLADIGVSNGNLTIGALTRHNDVVKSDLIATENQTVAAAAPWIADPLVRNLGTVGGSLAHADPQGDWGSVMLACGAEVVATSTRGERTIGIDDFLVDFFTNALEPDELLTEIRVPRYTGPAGGTYLKLERKVGDYATVGVAVHLQLTADRSAVEQAGIALTGVGPKNIKASAAEATLVGQAPGDDLFAEAGELAAQASSPHTDVRGPADYKRSVVATFVRRGLAQAADQARSA